MKKIFLKLLHQNKFLVLSGITERIFFFIIFLFIARRFNPELYGQLITIFSLANILIILFDLGLPVLMQKELSALNVRSYKIFNNAIILNILMLPLYLITICIFYQIFYSEISFPVFIITVLSVYIFSLGNLLNKALYGLSNYKITFTALFYSRIVCMAFFFMFIYFYDAGLSQLLLTLLLSALLQLIILFKDLKSKHFIVKFGSFDFKETLKIITISLPIGLAVIFNFLYDKIDLLLISGLLNFENAAYYNIGYGIFKTSTIFFSFLFIAGLTKVSYLSRNRKGVKLFFIKYLRILLCISVIITAVLFTGADFFIKSFYTDKFSDSVTILKVLSFATTGLALNNLTGIMLTGLGLFKMNMIVTLSGLIINVILNIIFIPHYGIIAAALITLITEYFIFAGGYFFIRNFFKSTIH
ncbi:MAG: oligosaccharide flippase family protein [Ignavibacteria bacterium]